MHPTLAMLEKFRTAAISTLLAMAFLLYGTDTSLETGAEWTARDHAAFAIHVALAALPPLAGSWFLQQSATKGGPKREGARETLASVGGLLAVMAVVMFLQTFGTFLHPYLPSTGTIIIALSALVTLFLVRRSLIEPSKAPEPPK